VAGYLTRLFSRRDTYVFSLVAKQVDIYSLLSGRIKRLFTPVMQLFLIFLAIVTKFSWIEAFSNSL
jgi:hypothetical protein